MATILAIASGKGGVGKTLVSAALSWALQQKKYKVLAVDGDMGLRNLDLAFGVQDEILYDAFDVLKLRCTPADALISLSEGFDFLPASQKKVWEKLDVPSYLYLVEQLSKAYDYVIIDCPPGRGQEYKNAVALADQIIFVAEPTWASLRDTERIMRFCDKHKMFDYAVLFNNFYRSCDCFVSVSEALQLLDPEHIAGLLPHDEEINGAVQHGRLQDVPSTNPFMNALAGTVQYILADQEPDISSLEALLPESIPHQQAAPQGCQHHLTLRERLRQSHSWRHFHR